jgi:hypothetical protein
MCTRTGPRGRIGIHSQLIMLAVVWILLAVASANPRHILLHNGIVDTETAPDFLSAPHSSRHFHGLSSDELLLHPLPATFLIHLDSNQTSSVRDQLLQDHDLPLQAYLPHHTFVVLATHAQVGAIANVLGVLWVGALSQQDKISPTVLLSPPNHHGEFLAPVSPLAAFNVTIGSGVLNGSEIGRLTSFEAETNTTLPKAASSLIVTLTSAHTLEDLNLIVDRLREDLLHDDRCRILYYVPIKIVRAERIRIDLRSEVDFQKAAQVIADDPAVMFVERRMQPQLFNRWARGILETGLQQSADYTTGAGLLSSQYGLHGQGQVIGIADTGIDYRHCFFNDPNYYPPFKAHKPMPTSADIKASDFYHRKIVQYVVYGDAGDDQGGHGTHTSGTIAGQSIQGNDQYAPYEGMAQQR